MPLSDDPELDRETATTGSGMAVSFGGPHDHAACDAEIARLRKTWEDRLALLRTAAADFRQAADGYTPPDRDLTMKTAGLDLAVRAMEGNVGEEGLVP